MKKTLKKLINIFYLSRSESRGFMILMLLMLLTIAYHYYQIQKIKNFRLNAAQIEEYETLKATFEAKKESEKSRVTSNLQSSNEETRKQVSKKAKFKKQHSYNRSPKKKQTGFDKNITLNQVDSVQLKRVYGIGKVLSKRIIKFRDKLGGFHRKEQLLEVYGLDSITAKKVLERFPLKNNPTINKININQADLQTLGNHPYISYGLAKVIVNYRDQHGDFTDLDSLENIIILDTSTLQKISPYLEI